MLFNVFFVCLYCYLCLPFPRDRLLFPLDNYLDFFAKMSGLDNYLDWSSSRILNSGSQHSHNFCCPFFFFFGSLLISNYQHGNKDVTYPAKLECAAESTTAIFILLWFTSVLEKDLSKKLNTFFFYVIHIHASITQGDNISDVFNSWYPPLKATSCLSKPYCCLDRSSWLYFLV